MYFYYVNFKSQLTQLGCHSQLAQNKRRGERVKFTDNVQTLTLNIKSCLTQKKLYVIYFVLSGVNFVSKIS